MATDADENPSNLRKIISETHSIAAQGLARAVIAEKGLKHVKMEDLVSLPLAELEAKAVEIETQREEAGMEALRSLLESKGVTDIDAAIASLTGGNPDGDGTAEPPAFDAEAVARARGIGATPGQTGKPDLRAIENDGPAQLQHYFEAKEAKR